MLKNTKKKKVAKKYNQIHIVNIIKKFKNIIDTLPKRRCFIIKSKKKDNFMNQDKMNLINKIFNDETIRTVGTKKIKILYKYSRYYCNINKKY